LNPAPEGNEREEAPRPVGDSALRLLRTALARARRALLWERVWPLLAAIAATAALFFAVSWAGLWLALPPLGRIAGLVIVALIFLASLVPAAWLRLPKSGEALQRLDRNSGLQHRPATTITDSLATGVGDPVADALWRAHLQRASDAARGLRAGWARPHLAARDPYAVRALILLALVTTFFAASGDRTNRIAAAFDWRGMVAPKLYRVDAWVTPPAYTGRAPVLLPGIRHDAPAPGETAAISVPAASELVIRANGLSKIELTVQGDLTEEKSDSPAAADGSIERRFKIAGHGAMSVDGLPAGPLSWSFRAVPERPPVISLLRDRQVIGRATVSLSY
jgi:uncharacterized protein (TIGR02302 family)